VGSSFFAMESDTCGTTGIPKCTTVFSTEAAAKSLQTEVLSNGLKEAESIEKIASTYCYV
jgi:hypothetical protein